MKMIMMVKHYVKWTCAWNQKCLRCTKFALRQKWAQTTFVQVWSIYIHTYLHTCNLHTYIHVRCTMYDVMYYVQCDLQCTIQTYIYIYIYVLMHMYKHTAIPWNTGVTTVLFRTHTRVKHECVNVYVCPKCNLHTYTWKCVCVNVSVVSIFT